MIAIRPEPAARVLPTLVISLLLVLIAPAARADFTGVVAEVVATDVTIDGRELCTLRLYATYNRPGDSLYLISPNVIEIVTPLGIGDVLLPWGLETTDPLGFYQHPLGGNTSLGIDAALFAAEPDLAYDSWVTVGRADQTANALQELAMDWAAFEAGGPIDEDNGSVYIEPFAPQGDAVDGRVLIAQLTVSLHERVSGTVNLQGVRANGMTYQVNAENFLFEACATPTTDLGYGLEGGDGYKPRFMVCGDLGPGGTADVALRRAAPNTLAVLFLSTSAQPLTAMGGTIVPAVPFLPLTVAVATDAGGEVVLSATGVDVTLDIVAQWLIADPILPYGVAMSNALVLHLGAGVP